MAGGGGGGEGAVGSSETWDLWARRGEGWWLELLLDSVVCPMMFPVDT